MHMSDRWRAVTLWVSHLIGSRALPHPSSAAGAVRPPTEQHIGATDGGGRRRYQFVIAGIVIIALVGGGYTTLRLMLTSQTTTVGGAINFPAEAPASFGVGAASQAAMPSPVHASLRAMSSDGSAAQQAKSAAGNGTSASSSALSGRLIARTGEIDLQVADIQRAFTTVSDLVARHGGYVADSNNDASTATGGAYAATLTLEVPAASFAATMSALAALPHHEVHENSSSQDITDSYHDLQASLAALQVTRTQLMALMRQARKVDDAMAVLSQLTDVNTNINTVESQIMASANSVTLSTITVNLTPEPRAAVRRHPASTWQPGRALAAAATNVRLALQTIATVAIYGVTYLALPLLLVALTLLVRRVRRWALHT